MILTPKNPQPELEIYIMSDETRFWLFISSDTDVIFTKEITFDEAGVLKRQGMEVYVDSGMEAPE